MSGEKTFAPSEKRLRDAAKNGDILRSRELATAVAVLVGAAWLKFAGPWMLDAMARAARQGLTWDRAALEDFAPGKLLANLALGVLPPLLMLAVGVMLAVTVSQVGLADGRWVGANLLPKGNRINPLSGLKRMFGAQGWIEVGKGFVKVLLLGAIAWNWGSAHLHGMLALGRGAALSGQLMQAWDALTGLMFALAMGLVVIALVDFPVQWLRRFLRLRMSQQEVRDEHKESEGSPEKKAAIRGRQRQLAMGGVAKAMREAQFVLTNPTHFSVAMAYDPDKANAPVVLAKGRGEKALAMRELARELDVPMLEYPALARSVYFTTRENQVIREELYAAIAGVLAFVFSLKRGERPAAPAVEVPVALRFDADGRLDPAAY
ncbi:EscU/YscU/HrcU family type III secretion system export apparatus switch protein [Novosphingobium sp. B 225]|uniref:EscU/YscU/HrcU family type III secretion system export apparatus switch protein n=1 Tax=Novosphingobium sp. B 225 TaxID=1961849 RepID=UPI000B4A8FE8|nr:EscU/YscU/HrcU family type III secretion system export apparatus switch protein [Novosphingobium sp. B 225]